jgi:uncharacterized protein (TIGR02246 family)
MAGKFAHPVWLVVALALVALLGVAAGHTAAVREGAGGGDPPSKPAAGTSEGREADEAAIRKKMAAFIQAFEKGDAKAVAAFWTPQGEFIDEAGTTVKGRDAIAKVYTELFAKNAGLKVEASDITLRFVSRDTAIEEGVLRVSGGKGREVSSSRYSVLHVREDGGWLMALVREWPIEGDTLRDIDWLIGTWEVKAEGRGVRINFDWFEGKAFLRGRFVVEEGGNKLTSTQLAARDPATHKLRSWVFESDGGFGESSWSKDGKRWLLEATATHADGRTLTATNVLTPLDNDTFLWQSTRRVLDGTPQPDSVPVKLTRVKN